MDNKVYVVKCATYEQVPEKLPELLGMMGGIAPFVAAGEKIMLKVNLLTLAEPERAITTHPSVVEAIGRMVVAAGASGTVIDSPGGGHDYRESVLKSVYQKSGMSGAAQNAGLALNYDTTYQAASFPEGRLIKHFEILTPLIEADGVINLCKLKTHTYMGMTGAVKNHFGAIPGQTKAGYHAKLNDTARFAQMLLDLSACVGSRLSIMDAVIGMEGNGPNSGDPRPIGLLLAATNPLALDLVASEVLQLPRAMNPVLAEAEKWGLQPTQMADVELIGADIAGLRIADFKFPQAIHPAAGLANLNWWQSLLTPLYRPGLTARPIVKNDRCVGCGVCRQACPMKAITIEGDGKKHAHIDDSKCIRCYCCHEMCPRDAIELRPGWVSRLLGQKEAPAQKSL